MLLNNTPIHLKQPGQRLQVLTIGRISTVHQDMAMIEAQYAEVQRVLNDIYSGSVNLIKLGERQSGEAAFRDSFVDACEHIESGAIDVVILFDLSKAGRLPRWMHQFIDICIDNNTRLLCPGDNLDTADPNWEVAAGAAVFMHGTHIQHTRHRIAAKAIYAFENGGMVTKVPFGFRKLTKEEATSGQFGPAGLRIAKAVEATPVIQMMRQRVLEGQSYEEVARWLDEQDIAV